MGLFLAQCATGAEIEVEKLQLGKKSWPVLPKTCHIACNIALLQRARAETQREENLICSDSQTTNASICQSARQFSTCLGQLCLRQPKPASPCWLQAAIIVIDIVRNRQNIFLEPAASGNEPLASSKLSLRDLKTFIHSWENWEESERSFQNWFASLLLIMTHSAF